MHGVGLQSRSAVATQSKTFSKFHLKTVVLEMAAAQHSVIGRAFPFVSSSPNLIGLLLTQFRETGAAILVLSHCFNGGIVQGSSPQVNCQCTHQFTDVAPTVYHAV